jgi:hypothetical protein
MTKQFRCTIRREHIPFIEQFAQQLGLNIYCEKDLSAVVNQLITAYKLANLGPLQQSVVQPETDTNSFNLQDLLS